MMLMRLLFLAVFFLGLPCAALAEPSSKYILDNGMTVVANEIPTSPVVALYALVKTGSATEGRYLGTGVSHFVEHMLFKGTEKRKVGEIAKEARALGGVINASTSFDYTIYTLELPAESFEAGLDILSDMLMNSRFDETQFTKERDVIIGEMRLHNDNPGRRLSDGVFKTVYQRHPYHHPIIGYEPLFKSLTRDELFDYYKANYIPNNIVFSVAGNVNANAALDKIKSAFADFLPKPYLLRNLPQEPDQISPREYQEEYPTDVTRLSLAFQGVKAADKDMFALDVLAMILGQGESSRLYQSVYKKQGLVQEISAMNFTPMDRGLFEISCVLDKEKIPQAITAVKDEIAAIKKDGVEARELEKAKQQVLSRYFFDRQTASDVAGDTAINEAYLGDPLFSQRYVEGIRQLTVADIKKVANTYLTDQALSIVVLKPEENAVEKNDAQKAGDPAEIQKVVLKNGLTVLLKEDHRLALVSARVALRAGLREELPEKNGLSNLAAALWTKGTISKTSAQIAQSVEERGMRLDTFSGQNSFGVSCEFLSQDLDFALNLLEDLVKNPAFLTDEMEKEKERLKTVIRARNDDIFFTAKEGLKQSIFAGHPYGRDVAGTAETIENIEREDIVNFYKALSVPGNMVLSIFGDFDKDKLLSILQKKFGGLKEKEVVLRQYELLAVSDAVEKAIDKDKEQAVVMVGFQAAAMSHPDRSGLEILSSVLGSPLNGRLFTKIRDELGHAYTLGGSYTPGIDTGLIQFYASTTQEDATKVKEILISEIEKLRTDFVSEKELLDTKVYLKGIQKMSLETNDSQSATAAFDELYGLGFDQYRRYAENIDKVTKEDIRRLAQTYLDSRKSVVVIVRKDKGASLRDAPSPLPSH